MSESVETPQEKAIKLARGRWDQTLVVVMWREAARRQGRLHEDGGAWGWAMARHLMAKLAGPDAWKRSLEQVENPRAWGSAGMEAAGAELMEAAIRAGRLAGLVVTSARMSASAGGVEEGALIISCAHLSDQESPQDRPAQERAERAARSFFEGIPSGVEQWSPSRPAPRAVMSLKAELQGAVSAFEERMELASLAPMEPAEIESRGSKRM